MPKIYAAKFVDIHNGIFKKAVASSDYFRQWLYPNLPRDYTCNRALDNEIEQCISAGLSVQESIDKIYEEHS